jgi:hypothetical protein
LKEKKMKRILALFIVCAMVSTASAVTELTMNVDQGQDVAPSDIIVLQFKDLTGAMTGGIAVGSYINVSAGDNAVHTWYAPPVGGWTIVPAGDGYTSSGNALWIGSPVPADDVIFTHEFHVPDGLQASDEILIDYNIAYSGGAQAGQIMLHVIPEPATIALLGLGALSLLRRRRKA